MAEEEKKRLWTSGKDETESGIFEGIVEMLDVQFMDMDIIHSPKASETTAGEPVVLINSIPSDREGSEAHVIITVGDIPYASSVDEGRTPSVTRIKSLEYYLPERGNTSGNKLIFGTMGSDIKAALVDLGFLTDD